MQELWDDLDARASASLPFNSKQHTRWLLALKVDRSKVIEILTCSQTSSFRDTLSHHNFCSCCDDSDEKASSSLPCNSKQHTPWLLALKVDRSKVIEILTCSQTSSFHDTLSHHNFYSCGDDSDVRASASLPCNSKQHTCWLLALKVDRSKVIEILSSRDICHLIFISTEQGLTPRSPSCTSASDPLR